MNVESIKEVHDKSIKFLCQAFLMVREKGSNGLKFATVLDETGIAYDDLGQIEEFLQSRDYIKRRTAGREGGLFNVSHSGYCHIEELILDGQLSFHRVSVDDDGSPLKGEDVDIKSEVLEE